MSYTYLITENVCVCVCARSHLVWATPDSAQSAPFDYVLQRTSHISLQLLFLFISQESLQGSRHCGSEKSVNNDIDYSQI